MIGSLSCASRVVAVSVLLLGVAVVSAEAASAAGVTPLSRSVASAASPVPSVPVPAAYWKFDEGSGTTAADSSGNGHAGALGAGVSWTAPAVGAHAIAVNGTASGNVTVPGPVVDTSKSFTVSAWVNLNNVNGYQTVVSIDGSSTPTSTTVSGFYLGLRADTGKFSFSRLPDDNTADNGKVSHATESGGPKTGTWYHLVGVDDVAAATLSLYLNGAFQSSVPQVGGWQATGSTAIGRGFYGGNPVDFVNGKIDDVEFFGSALSGAQVAALSEPAAWSFDQSSGTTAVDETGHGNTATLGASATWAAGPTAGTRSLALNGTVTANATTTSPVVNTAQPFSVSARVKLSSTSGTQTFASVDGTKVSGFALQLSGSTGRFAFTRLAADSASSTATSADATAAPKAGVWYQLTGVNDPADGTISLYVNGVPQATASYPSGWQATGKTAIGRGLASGSPADFTDGDIADVTCYDYAMTASDAAVLGTGGVAQVTVNAARQGAAISPSLFGAFLEDINHSGEGGIYAELVQNRSMMASATTPVAWSPVTQGASTAAISLDPGNPLSTALTRSLLLKANGVGAGERAGIANTGFYGVPVNPRETYTASFFAKATSGFTGPLTVDVESDTGTVYASATVPRVTAAWQQYQVRLATDSSAPVTMTNKVVVSTTSPTADGQSIWFDEVSLLPPTYLRQANDLRVDLMQKLAALHPAYFRVPGGNYLEGNTPATRFNWIQTIGPDWSRPGHFNSAWGYWVTDGFGLDEFLQMAGDAGAQPVLAVFAGYTLDGEAATGSTLTGYVTSAVDELHYVLDPVSTKWGAMRAAYGHPAPYDIKKVEIGNEDFFDPTRSYPTRYAAFYDAIHAVFPSLQFIATTAESSRPYNYLDEHFYEGPGWFEANSHYYDSVPRNGTYVMDGEFASLEGTPTPDLDAALGDASWLAGLERNSDLVKMASYAPLLVNVNNATWPTNLIGFNGLTSYGSPTYYAQIMLDENHGTNVVPTTQFAADNLQVVASRSGGTTYLTVINTGGTAEPTSVTLNGLTSVAADGTQTVLSGPTATSTNSIADPNAILPVTSRVSGLGATFTRTFPAYSITTLKLVAQ